MASKTSIKICLNKEIHIFRGEPTFLNLDNYVKSAFIKKLPQEFFLTYKDEEGDNITVSCDEDLQAFIESQKSLKLFIQENISSSDEEEQPKQQQQQQQSQQSQQQQPNLQDLLSSVMMGDDKKLEEVVNPLLQSFTAQMQNMTEQQNQNECQFKDLGKMFQQFKPFYQKQDIQKPNQKQDLQEPEQTKTQKEEVQIQEQQQKQETKLDDSNYVLIQEETEEKEKVSEVQSETEKPKVQEKKLRKNYSTVVRAKAAKISEILGGKNEEYYGVCDCKDFSKDTVEYIVGQLLETPQLTEIYSSYE